MDSIPAEAGRLKKMDGGLLSLKAHLALARRTAHCYRIRTNFRKQAPELDAEVVSTVSIQPVSGGSQQRC